MGVPRWKLFPWATWTSSSTHCHRTYCRLTMLTRHWAYSLGGKGCGRLQPCNLKLNNGRQEGEAWFRLGGAFEVKITLIMSGRLATGPRSARPWICSSLHRQLIIWLMSVSFLCCANTANWVWTQFLFDCCLWITLLVLFKRLPVRLKYIEKMADLPTKYFKKRSPT